MAAEWASFRLGPACSKVGSGATPRGGGSVYLPSGDVALIRSQNVYNDGFHHDGLVYLTKEHADQLGNVVVEPGDVLLNITGDSVARCCQVDPDVLPARVNQHVAIIRPDPTVIDARYLRYFLVAPGMQAHLLSLAGAGATRHALTKGMIESFEILAPRDVNAQRAIAAVLGALDDKIEINRKTARVLEGTARTLFLSWFVNFDPVRRTATGEPVGLPRDVAALFPKRLVDSAIGAVPEGWRVVPLPQAFEVNPTRTLRKGEVAPYLDMSNMPTQGHAPAEWVQREVGSGMRFMNGDTLVARITPCLENGKTAFVDFLAKDEIAWGSTEYIVLRPRAPLPLVFAYLLARGESFRTFAIQAMTGSSGRQRVPADSLANFLIAVPPENDNRIAAHFGLVVEPLFARMSTAMNQSRTLAALRDALLPKLISGQLRIADAEMIIGRAV